MQEPLPNNSLWVKVYVCKHSLSSQQLRAGCHPKGGHPASLNTSLSPLPTAWLSCLLPSHQHQGFVGTCSKPIQEETSRKQIPKNNKPSLVPGQTCSQKYFATGPEQHQCWQKGKEEHENQTRPKSGLSGLWPFPKEGPGKPTHHFRSIYYLWDRLHLKGKKTSDFFRGKK